jgi:hypothetical protein
MIDYKKAYHHINGAYKALIEENSGKADPTYLIEWIKDSERRPAVLSFTEGPERQIAYAIENLLNGEKCHV